METRPPAFVGFNWDIHNLYKIGKHGLTQEEVEFVFKNEKIVILEDGIHSWSEERFIVIGNHYDGRKIFICCTFRTMDEEIWIRIITARYMHKKEINRYEKLKK